MAAAGWLAPLEEFLQQAGLGQCLRALQIEAIVFPAQPKPDLESSLRRLSDSIQVYLDERSGAEKTQAAEAAGVEADAAPGGGHSKMRDDVVQNTADQKQTAQTVASFIDRQQESICRSNRDEFLLTGGAGGEDTCARTDARGATCGVKLQVDLGRDSSSALGRSTAPRLKDDDDDDGSAGATAPPPPLGGLEERVENIRDHLNVRFVPEEADIYRRVAALEDRIMLLEREFPPWSAEHFKQPGRRYMQPPPVTVYRALPPSPHADPTSTVATRTDTALARAAMPRHKPQRSQPKVQSTASPHRPAPKRKKTGVHADSPLDAAGNPIFHACGRGVNSSLTRSVLAQLQATRKAQPPATAEPQLSADTSKNPSAGPDSGLSM
ncbi:hypothetical protein H4R19_001596 [Coemansia spiralis]|nr:hypothetical protein H4R19_001596 [Coemansia spiralis]